MLPTRLPGPCHTINARIRVPSSKSLTNRALIACTVADGGCIVNPLDCEDTRLLAEALATAGWPVRWNSPIELSTDPPSDRLIDPLIDPSIEIGARIVPEEEITLHLGNSGTGSRLLLSLLAGVPGVSVIDGSERLRQRPMRPLVAALVELGATIDAAPGGALPLRVTGRRLRGGSVTLEPGESSQFVTSLVMAAPMMEEGLDLRLVGRIPSRPYLDLTESIMVEFGADFTLEDGGRRWRLNPGKLDRRSYSVEGDWSAAAFFLAAVAVAGGKVEITSLNAHSGQGDRIMCDILQRAGMKISFTNESLIAEGPVGRAIEADLRNSPDLFPALAVVAAAAPAGSRLTGLEFLRHKESDRLSVMVNNLKKLGVGCEATEDEFVVSESLEQTGSTVLATAASDHRIAMAMAVAALKAGSFDLDDAECVKKSFPSFWIQWEKVISSASHPACSSGT